MAITATADVELDRKAQLKANTGLTLLNSQGGCELAADLEPRSLTFGYLFRSGGGVYSGGGWVHVRELTPQELEQTKDSNSTFTIKAAA